MFTALNSLGVFSFINDIGVLQAVLLIAGLLLLVVEAFTPGFGLAGGTGLVLVIVGIFLTARGPLDVIIMFSILIVIVAILLLIILRSAKKGKLSRKLILKSASRQQDGYSAVETDRSLLGQEGVALTILRPAGSAEFDGKRLDVVTEGNFIESGSKIKVVGVEGRRIVVEKID